MASVALMAVIFSSFGSVPSAEAHNSPYGYFCCTQRAKTQVGPLKVGYLAGQLPVDGNGDGVVNSFKDRLSDATKSLGTIIRVSGSQPFGAKYLGQVASASGANILMKNVTLPNGILGRTYMQPESCAVVHGPKVNVEATIYVGVAIRDDWFTQDNSRRALWESCPANGYMPTYSCSKKVDVGSTMLHELGHTIGLAHPSSVEAHVTGGPSPMTTAKCTIANDQATMCQAADAAGGGLYRTHRRTVEDYDRASVQAHF